MLQPQRSSSFPRAIWTAVLERGWAYHSDLVDLGVALDRRLYDFDFRALAEALTLPFRYVFTKPRFISADTLGFEALSVVDVVSLLIFLEKCGFSINCEQMVSDMLPQVRIKSYMTISEIDIFHHTRTRLRVRLALRSTESFMPNVPSKTVVCHTSNGYKIEALVFGEVPISISIQGPKWRKERPRVNVDCPVCGMRYLKGDPEEALNHRSHHARAIRLLQPGPHRMMQDRRVRVQEPEMVSHNSPIWMHREMYERAREFKTEMQFDFTQWDNPIAYSRRDVNAVGFLMTSEAGTIDGACAFRKDAVEWSLDWIWVRPDVRRTGLLRFRWASYLSLFGDFSIEYPISDAMSAFITKYGSAKQKEMISSSSIK